MQRVIKGAARQRGLTAISLVLIVGVAALILTAALKLFTPYLDYMTVSSSLTSLSDQGGSSTPAEIRSKFTKLLDINGVRDLNASIITIERNGPNYDVTADYEVRVPYMGNIDFVVKFNKVVQVPAS